MGIKPIVRKCIWTEKNAPFKIYSKPTIYFKTSLF